MSAGHQSLLVELETAVSSGSIGSRADVLRRVTDLFVAGSASYNDEQRALFDDVMGRLVSEIDSSARAAFGVRLASLPGAPPKVSRQLALDDSVGVAGPLLTHSEQLDEETLIAGARTKSQQHLLAISKRKTLSEGVTDVLVERGDQEVVLNTVSNVGARFSEFGYSTIVTRSKADEELALAMFARPEVPRSHLLALFSAASESLRIKLENQDRRKADLIQTMIKQASDQVQTEARDRSPEFAAAYAAVARLHGSGSLAEDHVRKYADAGQFDETVASLALLGKIPLGAVERALVHKEYDQLVLLIRSIGFSWETTKAILQMKGLNRWLSPQQLEHWHSNFIKLRPETARTTLQFFRFREQAATAPKNGRA